MYVYIYIGTKNFAGSGLQPSLETADSRQYEQALESNSDLTAARRKSLSPSPSSADILMRADTQTRKQVRKKSAKKRDEQIEETSRKAVKRGMARL